MRWLVVPPQGIGTSCPFVSFAMIIVSSVKSAPCAFTAETVKNNVKEIIKNP